jgi:hypothetical protein
MCSMRQDQHQSGCNTHLESRVTRKDNSFVWHMQTTILTSSKHNSDLTMVFQVPCYKGLQQYHPVCLIKRQLLKMNYLITWGKEDDRPIILQLLTKQQRTPGTSRSRTIFVFQCKTDIVFFPQMRQHKIKNNRLNKMKGKTRRKENLNVATKNSKKYHVVNLSKKRLTK